MLKVRSYLIIAFAVYVLTLLSALPASMVASRVDSQISAIQINDASGTLWNGRIQGSLLKRVFSLSWDLHLLELFLFRVSADIHLKAELVELKSRISLSYKQISISDLSGLVKAKPLNILLRENGLLAEIEQDIYLKNIRVKRSSAKFVEADGGADWSGGTVRAKDLSGGKAEFPALHAGFSLNESGLVVALNVKESSANLINVDLSHDGRASLKFKERIGEYVKIPKQLKQGDPNMVMFEWQRQIFETQGKL